MTRKRYAKETKTVDLMIALYCRKHHHPAKKSLCPECKELSDYCHRRLALCPWGDAKPFCSNCKIHCYDQAHRERIRATMRYAGPRMIFHHPILACRHVIETKREKKRLAKQERNGHGEKR